MIDKVGMMRKIKFDLFKQAIPLIDEREYSHLQSFLVACLGAVKKENPFLKNNTAKANNYLN
jgi:hypothetical protein